MDNELVGKKLKYIRHNLGVNQIDMAEAMGITQSMYSRIEKGLYGIQYAQIQCLVDKFNIDSEYLTDDTRGIIRNKDISKEVDSDYSIPYYDIEISAGPITFYQDYKEMPSQKIEIPFIKDVDLAMPVYGDSMYPKIKNGDIVLLKEVDKALIMFGEIYLVITNDYRVLKYVRKHISREHVTLLSENDRFDPVEITKDEILHIFLYKGKFEKSQI